MCLANLQPAAANNMLSLVKTLQNQVRILIDDNKSLKKSVKKTKIKLNALKFKQDIVRRMKLNLKLYLITRYCIF